MGEKITRDGLPPGDFAQLEQTNIIKDGDGVTRMLLLKLAPCGRVAYLVKALAE
jgi:hypothetical protein